MKSMDENTRILVDSGTFATAGRFRVLFGSNRSDTARSTRRSTVKFEIGPLTYEGQAAARLKVRVRFLVLHFPRLVSGGWRKPMNE